MRETLAVPGLEMAWSTDPANGSHPNEDCVTGATAGQYRSVVGVGRDGRPCGGRYGNGLVCECLSAAATIFSPADQKSFEAFLRASRNRRQGAVTLLLAT